MSLEDTRRRQLNLFKQETDTHLLTLQQRLIDLERDPANEAYIREIFRAAHSIKGDAQMMGFGEIREIAHAMEDIFGAWRDGSLQVKPAANDVLFEATDAITSFLEAGLQGQKYTLNTAELAGRLRETAQLEPTVAPLPVLAAPAPVVPVPVTVIEEKPLPKYHAKFKEEADTHLLTLQRRLVELESDQTNKKLINEIFRAAHTIKGNAQMVGFRDIVTIAGGMEDVFAELREGKLTIEPQTNDLLFEAIDTLNNFLEYWQRGQKYQTDTVALTARLTAIARPHEVVSPEEFAVMSPVVAMPALASANTGPRNPPASLNDDVIRVAVRKLDDLMNIAGELVLGKMQAEATLTNLRKLQELVRSKQRINTPIRNIVKRDTAEAVSSFELKDMLLQSQMIDQEIENLLKNILRDYEEHTSQLQNRVDELENNILSIRMLPLETIYQDFPRLVRDTARQNGREQPNFSMLGGEIELDKKVLEGVKDPLVHIVRNALDHGIKRPEQRTAAGKSAAGNLTIAASQEGGYVSISVTDDGAGIDPQHIRQTAIKKKLLSEAKSLATPDDEILNLIYEPGFSTAEFVTDISGRGVGMEVVKNNLDRLGGQVQVATQKGLGTTITLRVPLTLATSRALLVRMGEELYAIPAPSIESMIYLSSDEVLSREGRDVILHRNYLIPVVRLEELIAPYTRATHPLFQYLRANKAINLPVLVATSPNYSNGGNSNNTAAAALEESLMGLTLADPKAHLQIRQMQNGTKERVGLQRLVFERLPAVVVGTGDRRVCFLVDELVDETEVVVKSLSPLLKKALYVNSVTIMGDGRVVLILDIPNLISATRTLTRSGLRRGKDKQAPSKRILVVDDSITTRELEKSILEAQGYIVELADDGTVALEMLQNNKLYDLVVSDVEMPRMDGFELTSQIKASPELRALPVIIVSSLNSDANKQKGMKAGAQAYITKGDFNQNNLLDTIEYLTK